MRFAHVSQVEKWFKKFKSIGINLADEEGRDQISRILLIVLLPKNSLRSQNDYAIFQLFSKW